MESALDPGKVAVITGAASGIGLACARACALRYSMQVVLVDSDFDALDAAATELSDQSMETIVPYPCDVTDAEAVDALHRQVFAELGGCHFLFLNAGIGGGGGPLSGPEGWRETFEVNLFGVLHGLRAFVPTMMKQATSSVVAITSSRAGVTNPPGDAAYNASKAAVRALAESLEHHLRNSKGCQVTSRLLLPGMTESRFVLNAAKRRERRLESEAVGKEANREGRHPAGDGSAAAGTSVVPAPRSPGQAGPAKAEEVVGLLLHSVHAGGPFYVVGEDGEMNAEQFATSVRWSAEDLARGRPPLSRWLEPHRSAYLAKL